MKWGDGRSFTPREKPAYVSCQIPGDHFRSKPRGRMGAGPRGWTERGPSGTKRSIMEPMGRPMGPKRVLIYDISDEHTLVSTDVHTCCNNCAKFSVKSVTLCYCFKYCCTNSKWKSDLLNRIQPWDFTLNLCSIRRLVIWPGNISRKVPTISGSCNGIQKGAKYVQAKL